MAGRYPRVEINLGHLKHNTKIVVDLCKEHGISVSGVIKGATGDIEVARAMAEAGVATLASSRLEQLEDVKNANLGKPLALLRVPMLSEVEDLVRICDMSLQSELEVIRKTNVEAKKLNKVHKIILMADMGDLREGFWDKDEMIAVCKEIDTMENVYLAGIGTNLGCYGSISPTKEKLEELVALSKRVEEALGRKLDIVSGGATSSLMRLYSGDMPEGINHLRIGEGILLAHDYVVLYNLLPETTGLYHDIFRLKAEVIEAKTKPSYPQGEIAFDAFGHKPEYEDRGMRKKVLLGMGKVDYAYIDELIPMDEGVELLGASSDHTIMDVTEAKREFKVGDIVEFEVCYATMVYITNCRNVQVVYV